MTTSIINDNVNIPLDIYGKDKYHKKYIMGIFMMDRRHVSSINTEEHLLNPIEALSYYNA